MKYSFLLLLFCTSLIAQDKKHRSVHIDLIQPRIDLQSNQCDNTSGLGGSSSDCYQYAQNKIGFGLGLMRSNRLFKSITLETDISLNYLSYNIDDVRTTVSLLSRLYTSSTGSLTSKTLNLSPSLNLSYTIRSTTLSIGGFLGLPLRQFGKYTYSRTTHIEMLDGPEMGYIVLDPKPVDNFTKDSDTRVSLGIQLSIRNQLNDKWALGLQLRYAVNDDFYQAPLHNIQLKLHRRLAQKSSSQ